jgi:hypothetical protein
VILILLFRTNCHRPCFTAEPKGVTFGRGHVCLGFPIREGCPGRARCGCKGTNDDRHRPSVIVHPERRLYLLHQRRGRLRIWHSPGAVGSEGRILRIRAVAGFKWKVIFPLRLAIVGNSPWLLGCFHTLNLLYVTPPSKVFFFFQPG